jgi:type IV pilus assembly protein PilX
MNHLMPAMNAIQSMQPRPPTQLCCARGFVLIASLLLLLVMTLLALTMFHSFGVQELVAGNVREKQRALQSALAAEQYAEMWLTAPGNVLTNTVDCSTVSLQPYSATSVPYICLQPISFVVPVTQVPWKIGAKEVGFMFFPGSTSTPGNGDTFGDMYVSQTGALNGNNEASYVQVPRFYIGLLSATASQAIYRIDAWNWAGTPNTAAVVEANYSVTCATCSAAGP